MISRDNPYYPLVALTGFQDKVHLRTGFVAALLGALSEEARIHYYSGRLLDDGVEWRLREAFDPQMGLHSPYLSCAFGVGPPLAEDWACLDALEWNRSDDPVVLSVVSSHQLSLVVRGGGLLSAVLIDSSEVELRLQAIEAIALVYVNLSCLLERGSVDSLTGLMNRRTFEEKLNPLFRPDDRHRRQYEGGRSDYIAILDIDLFKQVNDRFGHLYGDEVLVLLGRMMRETFRDHDWLFRIGGEEFVVVARSVMGDPAMIFERFRELVARQHFPQVGQVTVSLGYTRLERSGSLPDVLGRADEALYYAKGNGRNQIACYEALCEQGLLSPEPAAGGVDLF